MKKFQRYDLHTAEECPKGRLFHHNGAFVDLSTVRLLGFYVDTVRQLYKGTVNSEFYEFVMTSFSDKKDHIRCFGYDWMLGRNSRDSGYQFRLQNNDLGVIILFKSFHSKPDTSYTHCKIELSPHYIESRSPSALQEHIDTFAAKILDDAQPHQCAPHLAVDLQGFFPGKEFSSKIKCKSRRIVQMDAIETASWDLNEISTTYGRGQSFLFGSASGLQMGVYNKTVQAKAIDKLDYMQDKWKTSSGSHIDPENGYNSEIDVFRFELRFHHSVIQQFCDGSIDHSNGSNPLEGAKTYRELAPYLQKLWEYGVNAFKLMYNTTTLDPFWSILQEEVKFQAPDPIFNIEMKRHYKTAQGFSGKNVDLFMGNWISLCARQRKPAREVWRELKSLSTFPTIQEHYDSKGIYSKDLKAKIKKALKDRELRGFGV